MQSRLCHEGEKPQRFERNGFTAGIRARDDKRIVIAADGDIHRNDLVPVDEGVARLVQTNGTVIGENRFRRLHPRGQFRLCKDEGKLGDVVIIQKKFAGMHRDLGGDLMQDPLNLMRFLGAELPEAVVRLDHGKRLDKECRTRGRGVVYQSLDLVAVLRFDRDNVTSVSRCYDIFLKILGVRPGGYVLLERVLDVAVLRADLSADVCKRRTCFVGNHILRQNGARNAILQVTVGDQAVKNFVKRRRKRAVDLPVIEKPSCGTEDCRHGKQFLRGQRRALVRAFAGGGNIRHHAERRRTLCVGKPSRVRGTPESLLHRLRVVGGSEEKCLLLCAFGHGTIGKHFENFIKLQCVQCFSCNIHRNLSFSR